MNQSSGTKKRKLLLFGLVVALILIGIRAALPHWVQRWVNDQIDTMGDYHGQVEDVDLHLWRGAYSVDELIIEKRTADIPVSLLEVPVIDFSLSWSALFDGKIVASAEFYRPEVNFVDGKGALTQSGSGVNWRERLEALAPIRLDEVKIEDGEIWFHNFTSDPPVDLKASHVQASLKNLTNSRETSERAAEFEMSADAFEEAPLEMSGRFDPLTFSKNFYIRLKVSDLELTSLNEFLRAYANVDVARGNGEFIMELKAGEGKVNGYAKPLFRDVQVFSWKQDVERQEDNPFRVLWEALAGGIENILKNQENDQIATRVEIDGTVDDPDASAFEAIKGILINAFVDAYKPMFEDLPASKDANEEPSDS